jgi:hypothetical protein
MITEERLDSIQGELFVTAEHCNAFEEWEDEIS